MKQYYHQTKRSGKFTVVADVPLKHKLLDLDNTAPIVFDVGVTHCSEEDNYVKGIGRIEACRNIRIGRFQISNISNEQDHWRVCLRPFDIIEKEIVLLDFKVFKIGNSVHFVFAETRRV